MTMQPRRASSHALVDALPEQDLADAEHLLQSFAQADPALRAALLAPVDDEPLSAAEIAEVEQARAEIARGEYVTDDELDALLSQRST